MIGDKGVLNRDELGSNASSLAWRKSSRSLGNGNCVETARLPTGHRAVRDSKDKDGGVLLFTPDEWSVFIDHIKGDKPGGFSLSRAAIPRNFRTSARDHRKGHRRGDGTPRIVRAAPSTCMGTRRSFLPAPAHAARSWTLCSYDVALDLHPRHGEVLVPHRSELPLQAGATGVATRSAGLPTNHRHRSSTPATPGKAAVYKACG